VEGDLIAITVNWDATQSLTAWVGQLVKEKGVEQIKSMWLLTTNVPDAQEPQKAWSSVLAGADSFTRP
jgi:hypothetical protein